MRRAAHKVRLRQPAVASGCAGGDDARGIRGPAYDPAAAVVVTPGATSDKVTLIDTTATGVPFERPAGTDGNGDVDAPPDVVAALTVSGPSTTTTTTATTSTTAPPVPTDVTATRVGHCELGVPERSVPGVVGGRWRRHDFVVLAGPGGGRRLSTRLGSGKPLTITSVTIVGNGQNADPANRKGFGFGHVEIVLFQVQTEVFRQGFDLPGTPDPTVSVQPNIAATSI